MTSHNPRRRLSSGTIEFDVSSSSVTVRLQFHDDDDIQLNLPDALNALAELVRADFALYEFGTDAGGVFFILEI